MTIQVLYENKEEDLFTRLLKIRNIDDNLESFLNPTFADYWIDPFLLSDMEIAVERIIKAVKNNEKIMVFGDYDVDGVTASYLLYSYVTKFLNYKNISIKLPNRLADWYWIKPYHLDEIKALWVTLVITVDNWITAVQEALHAKAIGLDLIITDHHHQLGTTPEGFAVVNPQISPDYSFKWICGAWVAFKLACAISNRLQHNSDVKNAMLNYLLPIAAIWTVADCMPLVHENRLFVKMWLDIINWQKNCPPSIKNFVKYLWVKTALTPFHISFMIAPRLNAWGRMTSPYDSLNCLLYSDPTKQQLHLDKLEALNNERKKVQDDAIKIAESVMDKTQNIMVAASEEFHEWVVGIVAGRVCEKYNKPSVIFSINLKEQTAVASLRGPEYFSVIEMLEHIGKDLERFGWHKQAGWMTVKLDKLEMVIEKMYAYAMNVVPTEATQKAILVDTQIYWWELKDNNLWQIAKLEPFGEWNQEPVFMLEDVYLKNFEKIWKNWKSHLKVSAHKAGVDFSIMFWWKWEQIDKMQRDREAQIVGKLKADTYNGGFFIDGSHLI